MTVACSRQAVPTRRWALVRLTLGVSQMAAAAFALGLLAADGVSARALGSAVTACTITTVSVLLFGRRSPKQ